jgi:hypothetical protein
MRRNRTFRKFEDWHAHDVEQKLGIRPQKEWEAMSDLVSEESDWPAEHDNLLQRLQNNLYESHENWNESELQLQFIGPLLSLVELKGPGFASFSQRKLVAQLGDYRVEGYVDWMTASGTYEPIKPYFFIHEYKRQMGAETSPLGQLLIAMLAAATLNADGKPIYGCYVLGRYWSFVLLQGQHYGVSQGFDALDRGELGRIWHTLRRTRELIVQRVAEEQAG